MGANKTTNYQKCGDILINIKTMKNKTKVYTFHCSFCNADCDQLKKFSKHLEEEHLTIFEEDEFEDIGGVPTNTPTVLYQPEEIKVEVEITESDNNTILNANKSFEDFVNPLDTIKMEVKYELDDYMKEQKIINCTNDLEVKERNIISDIEIDEHISESFTINNSTSEKYPDDPKDSYLDDGIKADKSRTLKNNSEKRNLNSQPRKKTSKKKELVERKADKLRKLKNNSKNLNSQLSQETSKKEIIDGKNNGSNITKKIKRRRRPIYENILPFLLQQYQNYENLWQVDNMAFGVVNKKYEVYGKIAEDVKLHYDINISLEDVNYHINHLNQLYAKDKEQEIKCGLEKKNFVPESELYTEMSFLKQSQGPFLCPICNEILPRYDPYCQHMAEHTGNPPFKCPSCDFTHKKYEKYLIHKKRHLGILNFHCDVCGKGYLYKSDFEWHVTSHTGDKPFLCQVCGMGFRARHSYDNHIRRHEGRFRYECHICKRGFNLLHSLNTHIKSHLNIRDVICKTCGKGFTDTQHLRRHELIHGDVKGYKCNICGKAYYQARVLRTHLKSHQS